ncbi:MAG TPA: EAL domain-containing protein [Arsenicitalea sp.]|nr:EAL domain-containing protein [Arsenicitalea sp.]
MMKRGDGDNARAAYFAVFEQLGDAVVIVDKDDCIVFFNAAAERLWGCTRPSMIGQAIRQTLPEFGEAADAAKEVRIGRPDGTKIVASMRVSHLVADGQALRIAIIRDWLAGAREHDELSLLLLAANETDRVVLITDAQRKIIYVNAAFSEMFGYERAEVMGKTSAEVFAVRNSDPETLRHLKRRTDSAMPFQEDVLSRDKFGREIWVSLTVNPILNAAGTIQNVVCVINNVSEGKRLQLLQRDALEAVASDMPLPGIMALICRHVEALAPEVTCAILAVEDGKVLRPLAASSLPAAFGAAIDGVAIGPAVGSCGTAAYRGEPVRAADIENDPAWAEYAQLALDQGLVACWSSPIKLRDGRVAGTFAFYFREKREPSPWHEHVVGTCLHLCVLAFERHEAKAHIARLAYFDPLTGLPNRTALRERVSALIAARTPSGKPAAFFFLDIDRFKDVNDTLGHSVGDQFLVEIARRLQRQIGAGDIVSRLGGDEFVIILTDCDASGAAETAERVLACLQAPIVVDGLLLPASASIGISLYPHDGLDEGTLLQHADMAMYQVKAEGRGSYRFFSPHMNQMTQDRLMLAAALRLALTDGQLRLHYQPQVRAEDGSLQGVEALARWTHPVLGEISPVRFIALAESCGLIESIGKWALDAACCQLMDWRARGFDVPQVSVNVSPLHFRNRDLFSQVVDIVNRYGLSPHMLTVEITEGVIMDECPASLANATALHDFGIGLSMDDFGTGYSSLSHLAKLPVTELKIDRSFMAELEADANSQAVARAVIRIGQSLGMTVVAEGVETDAQRRFLTALQCDVLQGYLVCRPLAPAEFERWLPAYNAKLLPQEIAGAA